MGKWERLPDILRMLKTVWEAEPLPGVTMLCAASYMGFFGFLRRGEMTIPT